MNTFNWLKTHLCNICHIGILYEQTTDFFKCVLCGATKTITMKDNMIFVDKGLKLLKQFEGCKLISYKDIGGILTIGYGHTGPDVMENQTITQEQADNLLLNDCDKFCVGVKDLIKVQINDDQYSALVCFSYNVGLHTLANSTLLKLINLMQYEQAAEEFLKWNHVHGQVVPGLTNRRKAERALYLGTIEY